MADMLLLIDVQGGWARRNPRTVQTITQSLPALRRRMELVWVYMLREEMAEEFAKAHLRPSDRRLLQRRLGLPIYPAITDKIFFKTEGDAFTNPALCAHVIQTRPETLYLAGFMGTQCVRNTAIGGLGLRQSFNIAVLAPLTADQNDIYRVESFGLENHIRQIDQNNLELLLR
jgi:nicotinamidase-related amidase